MTDPIDPPVDPTDPGFRATFESDRTERKEDRQERATDRTERKAERAEDRVKADAAHAAADDERGRAEDDREVAAVDRADTKRRFSGAMKIVTLFSFMTLILVVVMEIQLVRRDKVLDRLETASEELRVSVNALKADTKRIREVADAVGEEDPAMSAAIEDLFRKVDAIYEAVVLGESP